ncbi:MAG: putative bifunctional diguanylate cyclase/phosphodiesterase [Gemmatimonadota bacterium]
MAPPDADDDVGFVGDEALGRAHPSDSLIVGRPVTSDSVDGDQQRLQFSRGLVAPDGSPRGVAVVEVDPSFFVSGYETSRLGERGVLGVLGTEGVFRVRRTGERVSTGDSVDYASVIQDQEATETRVVLTESPWDGVRRYTSARQLFEFPLAVVVGLSEQEQLAGVEARSRTYLQRAGGASLLLILVIGALGRMSWKLDRIREREAEASVAHARRVEHLAYHDGLTGLPNRSFLSRLLERSISRARRYDRRLAVLFLDLDRFKKINDTLGHEAGDHLLREVADRLESTLRDSDTVARMGGDEFVVLVPELEDEAQAAEVAGKMLDVLREPLDLLGQKFHVTGSIGISLYPADGEDEQTLMKNADIAMYEAKEGGKNDFRFYSEEMSGSSRERLQLESSLRRALENEEFELHYQARRDLDSDRITGMEALLRWRHPELGLVEPLEFIPLAEETGFIVPIGRWVLETACRQNVAWHEEGLPRLSVAVNLSARQFFDGNLIDDIRGVLERTGMDAELLELEICESVLTRDADRTLQILEGLKKIGVKITIDNFGTGYSSLSVLRRFPLDSVKVDRLFIRDSSTDRVERDVTDAIVAMGRSLSSSLVAQGVETREQADYLREHACDEVQGFYFNRPVPADDVSALFDVRDVETGR